MNKTAIKNFAIEARKKLIADVCYRAGLVGIMEKGIQAALPQSDKTTEFYDIGTANPHAVIGYAAIRQRRNLAEAIRRRAADSDYPTAYRCIMEEVAYTWFNRLIAVRFMEVNDYLPGRVRALSSESGKIEPDLVTNPFDAELSFTAEEEQAVLQLKQDNKLDELFRLLFIKQCNALAAVLPALFEQTEDYTELLLNLSVVDQEGVVWHLTHDIPEEDFNVEKGGQVEIIGWLYQYYNTEPKAQVFARPSGQKIKKEEIPAATQLFTPDWIVRYMVENSLGRLWIEHERSMAIGNTTTYGDLAGMTWGDLKGRRWGPVNEKKLAEEYGWKYYLDEAEQEPDVAAQLEELRVERRSLTPEDIKVIDPCMGSGHILVYAFDVLMQIYEKAGWERREAARSIVENNLYGIDIDQRAFQLAYFAIMMKARQYDRKFLSRSILPNLCHTQKGINLHFARNLPSNGELATFFDDCELADHMGSLIIPGGYNTDALKKYIQDVCGKTLDHLDQVAIFEEESLQATLELIQRNNILSQQYDVVITNPPYMGSGNMDAQLSEFVKKYYPDSKADLFAVFIERGLKMVKPHGYLAMITQHAWMFLSSFEKLRAKLQAVDTVNMAHLGARAFEEIGGEVVQTTSFVVRKSHLKGYQGTYCRLIEPNTQQGKEKMFLARENRYIAQQDNFSKIPGSPVAYWISDVMFHIFETSKKLYDVAKPRQGLATSDNDRFLKLWYEISIHKIGFGIKNIDDLNKFNYKWFPCTKGGSFRRWYGNNEYVVNWENDGFEIKEYAAKLYKNYTRTIKNIPFYFQRGLTWSAISSGLFSLRYVPEGFIFETKGAMCYVEDKYLYNVLALYNTCVMQNFLKIVSPTLDYHEGPLGRTPIILNDDKCVETLSKECVRLSITDWDSFETSWDFTRHPLVRSYTTVAEAYFRWEEECIERFTQLKANEEELNRIFIDIYGLQDELTPEVEDKDVTVRRADLGRDIRSLLSYAVGCMFGRYSLDEPGLILAGYSKIEYKTVTTDGDSPELEKFARKNPDGSVSYGSYYHWVNQEHFKSFPIDTDNIIPLTDENYLEDDIVSRLCQWLRVVYGENTLEENLDFIAKALGNKGSTSREVIRNYFLKDFFADHCKIYQKRPIYWLFDSGKQNGFKALVYLHRYTPDTIGKLRVDYLHRLQRLYASEIERMQDMIDNSQNPREVTASTKRKEKLQKQLKECREYDEKIAHLALARIELDLDDGVKVNYEKVQTAADGKKYPVLGKI